MFGLAGLICGWIFLIQKKFFIILPIEVGSSHILPGSGAPAALDQDHEGGHKGEEDTHHDPHHPVLSVEAVRGGGQLGYGLPVIDGVGLDTEATQ